MFYIRLIAPILLLLIAWSIYFCLGNDFFRNLLTELPFLKWMLAIILVIYIVQKKVRILFDKNYFSERPIVIRKSSAKRLWKMGQFLKKTGDLEGYAAILREIIILNKCHRVIKKAKIELEKLNDKDRDQNLRKPEDQ